MKIDDVISRIGDFSRDAVLITEAEPFDRPGPRILWVNDAFTTMMGYTREEVVGETPRLLQRGDFDPAAGRAIREALEAWRPIRQVVRNYTKDGRGVWIELDITPIADDTGWYHYWLALQRDVTERVETERRLAEAERRFELAASVSLIGVWDWDLRADQVYWSDEYLAMLGLSRAAFQGDYDGFAALLHPDDRARVRAAVDDHLKNQSAFDMEYRHRHVDGHYVDVLARGAVQRDADGAPIRMVGSVQDVTKERSRERELAEAKRAAEAANQAKSQFLANMSHEIRTPLNGVLGLTHLLARTELSEAQAQYVSLIETSGEALRGLVDDVLDISRIEAGEVHLRSEPYALADTLRAAVDAAAAGAELKGLGLSCEIAADLPDTLTGDARRLTQIVLNLVGNAVKFTEAGSVEVRAGRTSDGALAVTVHDTGIGIASDQIEHVFDRFAQADPSHTREHDGAGLGLAIARGLARAMGGEISAQSVLGAGSAFTLTLPLDAAELGSAPDAPAPAVPASERQGPVLTGRKVLVAEDNEINQQVLVELLREQGVQPVIAEDGVAALEALEADPAIDLVLLDLQMPRLSGEGVLAQLRRPDGPYSLLPVLVISANATVGADARVRALGADGFIAKPFDPPAVMAAIAEQLRLADPDAPLPDAPLPTAPLPVAAAG